MISAKVICDSISPSGVRLTTLELQYHRFVHSEMMTHRIFSRNASSSRAIPVEKMLKQVKENPAIPIHWGKNRPGMQAREECNNLVTMDWDYYNDCECTGTREMAWKEAADNAGSKARAFGFAGYHKQVVNRLLEPFQWISVVVTATEWDNFFKLRLHKDAQPEIQELARCMKTAMNESIPVELQPGDWHLPYVRSDIQEDELWEGLNTVCPVFNYEKAIKCSVARCARVAVLKHDGTYPSIEDDLKLYDRLVGSSPEHASPCEHVATPMDNPSFDIPGISHMDKFGNYWSGNFKGWRMYRKILEDTNWGRP